MRSLEHILPLLFQLNNKPYTLERYKVMRPLFRITDMPWHVLYKCGRQVGKSQNLAGRNVAISALIPGIRELFVLPLAEMTRRLSSNYVKPLIEQSKIRSSLIGPETTNGVLQKSFRNGSIMFFSYAFLDCTRVRGISADIVNLDEVQDIQWDFVPIIRECLSASEWALEVYTGTPKTLDNTIELLWQESSQAEWVIKCPHCSFYNVCASSYHMMRMLGSVENVKRYGTGLICYKCGRPIRGVDGTWVHAVHQRRATAAGYHVPQPILPLHYESPRKWQQLLHKRDTMATATFMNEVLGESCDVGTKLITLQEAQNACQLEWNNDFNDARRVPFTDLYNIRILGVDWGGGGAEEVSFTTIAVMGYSPKNRLEVIYGERLHIDTGDVDEVLRIIELFNIFACKYIAHDFCGAGSVHETLLIQAGMPMDQIIPINYAFAPTKNVIYYHKPDTGGSRGYYIMDKARSLMTLCALVKTKRLLFPRWQTSKDLVEDFTHLIEDKIERPGKSDVFRIIKIPKSTDDFAHACNYAAWGLFRVTGVYPNMASDFNIAIN